MYIFLNPAQSDRSLGVKHWPAVTIAFGTQVSTKSLPDIKHT